MSLSQLFLAVYLILIGLVYFNLMSIPAGFLGFFALGAGILILLEATNTFRYDVRR